MLKSIFAISDFAEILEASRLLGFRCVHIENIFDLSFNEVVNVNQYAEKNYQLMNNFMYNIVFALL